MSATERRREALMHQVDEGVLTVGEAAERMGVSQRQGWRVRGRWKASRAAGLVHGLRGQPSNRRLSAATLERVFSLYREQYGDYGPTLASEKLGEDHDVRIARETLRRHLYRAGLWVTPHRVRLHRRRRERRSRFGELVQLDGSHHPWLEQRGPQGCLMVLVDDATGRTQAFLAEEETTAAAYAALRRWIECYGLPRALYVDRKSVYYEERAATAQERRQGTGPLTHFGRACHRLGIEVLFARSPQAKGRVERRNGVLQDRLLKELRQQGLRDHAAVNRFLPGYFEGFNPRFEVVPASSVDDHRAAPSTAALNETLCWDEERTVQNDFTLSYAARRYQLEPQADLPWPREKITVRRRYDGSLVLLKGQRALKFSEAARQTTQQ
ncbi:MAG: ISNCY family transposase [bacterium]